MSKYLPKINDLFTVHFVKKFFDFVLPFVKRKSLRFNITEDEWRTTFSSNINLLITITEDISNPTTPFFLDNSTLSLIKLYILYGRDWGNG